MILHIANDYNYTKVHRQLYENLDDLNIKQKIFIPFRNKSQIGNNHFNFNVKESEYVYSSKINILHRIIFPFKTYRLLKSLESSINIDEIKLIHATTLFSDGVLAYKLNKKFNIPYVVAVRNTDINFYFNKRKELIPLGIKILTNASKIIFISEANRIDFINKPQIKQELDSILNKIVVINNGIDEFWLKNINPYKPSYSYNFLFIGRFDKNKNVERLIDALQEIRKYKNLPIFLRLVGGKGSNHKEVLDKITSLNWIEYIGEVYNKEELLKIFNESDYFSLVSHFETFGLVYIEALSQGKPILYTKGQGIDGMFNFKFGEASESKKTENIVYSIENLLKNNYSEINQIDFNQFNWKDIAIKYVNLYNEILK